MTRLINYCQQVLPTSTVAILGFNFWHRRRRYLLPYLVGILTWTAWYYTPTEAEVNSAWTSIEGRKIYRRMCAQCHGGAGHPPAEIVELLAPAPSDLTLESYKYGDTVEEIAQSIRQGIGSNMLRFNERLSEEQITAVANYVLTLKKENLPSVP